MFTDEQKKEIEAIVVTALQKQKPVTIHIDRLIESLHIKHNQGALTNNKKIKAALVDAVELALKANPYN